MIVYKIYNEEMRFKYGLDIARYLKGMNEGCIFKVHIKGKTSKYWNNSYNKIIESCKLAKEKWNKTYIVETYEIVYFNQITKINTITI